MQERIEELGLTGGKAPPTSGMMDVAKNLTDAEFQNDSTIQLEMVMLMSDMCKPTVGATARLMWVMRLQADVLLEVQAGEQSLKPRLLVDAGSVSDESTRQEMSSGDAEFHVVNLGCAAESLVVNCGKRDAVGGHDVDGQEIDPDSSTVRPAKRSGKRGKHMEVSTKYLSATTRTLARMPLYFGEAWAGRDGGRFERSEQGQRSKDSVHDDAQYHSRYSPGRSQLLDLLRICTE